MRLLRAHHITNLVTIVDSFLPRAAANPKGGRPLVLHPNEVIALLLFSSFVAPQRTIKGVYTWAQTYYYRRFHLCSYPSFVRKCHQALPGMCLVLDQLLVKDAPLRFMDSTMLHVCKLVRADRHRVAKGTAQFGKNWQGWHYGFKLHAAVNQNKQLCAIYFTAANEHDGQQVPPHPKQNKKLLEQWQLFLLHKRAKVECTFDYLKEHLLLETSFPRSVQGYALHYIRIVLAYQLMWGF